VWFWYSLNDAFTAQVPAAQALTCTPAVLATTDALDRYRGEIVAISVALQATANVAGADKLTRVTFTSVANGIVEANGVAIPVPSQVTFNPSVASWSFVLRKVTYGLPFQVDFVATDVCGDVPKFAGAGMGPHPATSTPTPTSGAVPAVATPNTSPTPTPTKMPTATPTAGPTLAVTSTPTLVATRTPTSTPTPLATSTLTSTPTQVTTSTPMPTPTPTASLPPTPTVATATPSATATATPVVVGEGTVYWRGDFNTCDTSQWDEVHTGRQDSSNGITEINIVTTPIREGACSAQFVTRADTDTSSDRAEITVHQAKTGGYEGQNWYYSWSTMFPSNPDTGSGWPLDWDWNNLIQWMDLLANCSPPLQIGLDSGDGSQTYPQLYLESAPLDQTNCRSTGPVTKWLVGKVQYDHWYDFTLHVNWSQNPSLGYVELWMDGVKVVPLTHVQTMDNGGGVYLEMQLYHRDWNRTLIVYHDGMRRHDAFSP